MCHIIAAPCISDKMQLFFRVNKGNFSIKWSEPIDRDIQQIRIDNRDRPGRFGILERNEATAQERYGEIRNESPNAGEKYANSCRRTVRQDKAEIRRWDQMHTATSSFLITSSFSIRSTSNRKFTTLRCRRFGVFYCSWWDIELLLYRVSQ